MAYSEIMQRLINRNRNGSLNVVRKGLPPIRGSDLYHLLQSITWPKFLALLMGGYLTINLIFGTAYFLCGQESFHGMPEVGGLRLWLESVFFSVQTFATIGYGRVAPVGMIANLLVTLEAFLGLMGLAIATGLLFSRFSRPTARVLFSEKAAIEMHDGVPSLVFRLANARLNQIVEAKVRVVLARDEKTAEGDSYRQLYDLELERDETPVFALSWTIVHPIDQRSPLFGQKHEDFVEDQMEIIVSLVGIDDTFAQPIHARHSFIADEIVWGGSFEDILSRKSDGNIHIDLNRFHRMRQPSTTIQDKRV